MALSMSETESSLQAHSWHFDFEILAFQAVNKSVYKLLNMWHLTIPMTWTTHQVCTCNMVATDSYSELIARSCL